MDKNMLQYQKAVKENINNLINENRLSEAKEILNQYQDIVKNDSEIYSLKAIIAMVEGDTVAAEILLQQGISVDIGNFDMLYNLGYLYHARAQYESAIIYYKRALQNAKEEADIDAAYEMLQELGINESKQRILDDAVCDNYCAYANEQEKLGNRSDAALYYGLAYRNTSNTSFKKALLEKNNSNYTLSNIFDVAAHSSQKRYIILSSCGWGNVYQRMHHIARSLVKFGHEVIYITPSVQIDVNSNQLTRSDLTDYTLNNMKIVDGVNIYSPIMPIYQGNQMTDNYTHLTQYFLDSTTNSSQTIIVTYMPYQIQVIKSLKGNFTHIYECVDDHSDLEYAFWGNKNDVIWEQELMDKADAITTTATALFLQRTTIEGRKNVYLSRNAVNEADFMCGKYEIPEDLREIPEPRIVYVGAIYEWFDAKLFYDVVRSNPDKSFVVIGLGREDILKESCTNLYILGAKKHSELKAYLQHMDIGIIPFKDNTDIIINCDPIKQYEYLASGLPVITTFMPESMINKAYTFNTNTKEGFNDAINQCLDINMDKTVISDLLVDNSWNERAALLCRIADKSIKGDYNARTISSLKQRLLELSEANDHPNYWILYALALKSEDNKLFLKYAEQAFNHLNSKYIERQYLCALIANNKYEKFIETASRSKAIQPYLISELIYWRDTNNIPALKMVMMYSIKNYHSAIKLLEQVAELEDINLLTGLYYYLIGESQKAIIAVKNIAFERKLKSLWFRDLIDGIAKSSPNLESITLNENAADSKDSVGEPNSIAILIPTKNTPYFVERCVAYFVNISDEKLKVNVYIMDASDDNIKQINKDLANRYPGEQVKHIEFDGESTGNYRVMKTLSLAQDKFCCYCADDDFVHPEGIIKSIEILKEHPDIVTAKGKSYVFVNNDPSNIINFPNDACANIMQDCPIERLESLVQKWLPQLSFLVFRREDLFGMMRDMLDYCKSDIEDCEPPFLEYLWYFYVPLYGKLVNIQEPLNVRDFNVNSGSYTTPGFLRRIEDGTFNKLYGIFKKRLLNCSRLDPQQAIHLAKSSDNIMKRFLMSSWEIPESCIRFTDEGYFDMELLRVGNQIVQGKQSK